MYKNRPIEQARAYTELMIFGVAMLLMKASIKVLSGFEDYRGSWSFSKRFGKQLTNTVLEKMKKKKTNSKSFAF